MSKTVLITGGTGLVGTRLISLLKAEGFNVRILSRSKRNSDQYESFKWDYSKGYIEEGAFDGVDTVVHLAGAGVADEKWTRARKEEIYNSRTKTTLLLFEYLKNNAHQVTTFISASAIGIYGMDTGNTIIKESSAFGHDFLAHVTDAWETASNKISSLGIRLVQMRIGVVLSNEGGALKELLKPPVAAPLGKGNQYMSWIHIDDLCQIILYGIETQELNGPYNAVGPKPLTNKQLTKEAAKAFKKPFIPIPVPSILLKLFLGEMSAIVLGGSRISSEKIQAAGFKFKYPKLSDALKELTDR